MLEIANYKIHSIDTGRFRLDGGAMFGVVPYVIWSKTNPPDEKNRIEMALRTLLLDDGNRRILIDTGIGTKFKEKEEKIYGVDHSKLNLDVELEKLGYSREDITDVFLTHLHFDHAGGTTYRKDGELQLTFPNAKYHVDKFHYEWALRPSRRDRASFLPENYAVLEKMGVLNLFDGGKDKLFDNIEFIKVHGHTPHMTLPKINGKNQSLLYCADLIPTSSHIPLPFIMGYDLNALTTLQEKEIILEEANREDWILFFEHDPNYDAARICKTEKNDFKAREMLNL